MQQSSAEFSGKFHFQYHLLILCCCLHWRCSRIGQDFEWLTFWHNNSSHYQQYTSHYWHTYSRTPCRTDYRTGRMKVVTYIHCKASFAVRNLFLLFFTNIEWENVLEFNLLPFVLSWNLILKWKILLSVHILHSSLWCHYFIYIFVSVRT